MKKHNFYAGPSILSEYTIKNAAAAVEDFAGTGLSILEISHRSKEFVAVNDEARALIKELLDVPAGYEVVTENGVTKAVLTSFAEAAFNPSTLQRYAHTVLALLITGAFVAIAIGAYYLLKNKNTEAGKKLMKLGFTAGLVTTGFQCHAANETIYIGA